MNVSVEQLIETINYGIDSFDVALTRFMGENDALKDAMDNMRSLVSILGTTAISDHQVLSYIISEYFDGEFLFSYTELKTEMEGYTFLVIPTINDDGSVKLEARRERQE